LNNLSFCQIPVFKGLTFAI